MPQLDDYQKKRLALWAGVGGTTAIIVALWAFVLPQQLARFTARSEESQLSQWMSARQPSLTAEKQTFVELLKQQSDRLNAVEKNQQDSGKTNNINIDELRAKINSGLNANAAAQADTGANANTDAPSNLNLPAGQAGAPAKP